MVEWPDERPAVPDGRSWERFGWLAFFVFGVLTLIGLFVAEGGSGAGVLGAGLLGMGFALLFVGCGHILAALQRLTQAVSDSRADNTTDNTTPILPDTADRPDGRRTAASPAPAKPSVAKPRRPGT